MLEDYLEEAIELLPHFADVMITHAPRVSNETANSLAQHAFGYKHIP